MHRDLREKGSLITRTFERQKKIIPIRQGCETDGDSMPSRLGYLPEPQKSGHMGKNERKKLSQRPNFEEMTEYSRKVLPGT